MVEFLMCQSQFRDVLSDLSQNLKAVDKLLPIFLWNLPQDTHNRYYTHVMAIFS